MHRFIIYMILLLISTSLSAQNLNPKKGELKKRFRKSIVQDSRKKISTLSNPWVIDNTDSLYFKAITIKLINPKKQYEFDFCEYVNWSFFRNDQFYLTESQTCREPSSAKAIIVNSRHWITIKESDYGLILETHNSHGIVDRFWVVSISKTEIKDEIILMRLTNKAN